MLEILNSFAHAALLVAAGGYFPGIATAPLLLGAGLFLIVRLRARKGVTSNPP